MLGFTMVWRSSIGFFFGRNLSIKYIYLYYKCIIITRSCLLCTTFFFIVFKMYIRMLSNFSARRLKILRGVDATELPMNTYPGSC